MGRTYWFECSRCGYRAKVSGRADRGLNFFVQTIACQDCKQLYDAVTQLKVPDEGPPERQRKSLEMLDCSPFRKTAPPSFAAAASLLTARGLRRFKWLKFKPQCPISAVHRVEEWKDPGRCPRCGLHLEKSVLPYRIWD